MPPDCLSRTSAPRQTAAFRLHLPPRFRLEPNWYLIKRAAPPAVISTTPTRRISPTVCTLRKFPSESTWPLEPYLLAGALLSDPLTDNRPARDLLDLWRWGHQLISPTGPLSQLPAAPSAFEWHRGF